MTPLAAPTYSAEEQELAVASLLRLNNALILDFLAAQNIKKANNKAEMRVRIVDALEANTITSAAIYNYLDTIETWGRQHVILYNGPTATVAHWSDHSWVSAHLSKHALSGFHNSKTTLALPKDLTLSSIEHSASNLRITALERREGAVREPDLDTETVNEDGNIFYKAYRYQVYRGFIIFEWDLVANQAFLQISQLPSGEKYEDATSRFETLLTNVLSLSTFSSICIRPVIKRLHELEELKRPEARSQGIAYKTLQGRTVEGRSAGASLGLFGEAVVDTTMANVRNVSLGHTGNFYWLPRDVNDVNNLSGNMLDQEVYVILIGDWRRCNFPVFYPESQVRYVLQRIRAIAAGAP
jgi:hypothetical protein